MNNYNKFSKKGGRNNNREYIDIKHYWGRPIIDPVTVSGIELHPGTSFVGFHVVGDDMDVYIRGQLAKPEKYKLHASSKSELEEKLKMNGFEETKRLKWDNFL